MKMEMTPEELFVSSHAQKWVEVCKQIVPQDA